MSGGDGGSSRMFLAGGGGCLVIGSGGMVDRGVGGCRVLCDALQIKTEETTVEIKTEETTVEPQLFVASENINVINLTLQESENDDEDIPMAPFKRRKKDQIKITRRTRLCRLFDEDSSDQEEDIDEDSSDQEEDLYEDSSDQEEFYDEIL
ncbi:hypothetical protein Tco_1515578 [Tanacetum coccineum]